MQDSDSDVNSEKDTIDGVKVQTLEDLNVKDPQPGIYKNIPYEIYDDLAALNSSRIRQACESALVYKRYMIQKAKGQEPGYPLEFGKAFALLCEDPTAFDGVIKAGPTKTPFTKAWVEETEANPDNIYVKEVDLPMLKSMMTAFRSHPYTKRYSYDAHNELTIVWVCEITEQLCKARIDIYKDGHVIDIKTAADVRPRKIKWQIIDLKYDIQVTFYFFGLRALGVKAMWAADFFIEKKELLPDVVPKLFNEEQLQECRDRYVVAINRIVEAEKSGVYDGYAREPLMDLYGFDEPETKFES